MFSFRSPNMSHENSPHQQKANEKNILSRKAKNILDSIKERKG